MNKKWMESEKQYIRDNCGTMKDKVIAKNLTKMTKRKVSLDAIRKQRQIMGLIKKCGRGLCEMREKN